MNRLTAPGSGPPGSTRSPWTRVVVAGCLIVFLIGLFRGLRRDEIAAGFALSSAREERGAGLGGPEGSGAPVRPRRAGAAPAPTAEEIVASKVSQFARSRREIAHAMARHFNVQVPAAAQTFFDAVEAGRWEEIEAAFQALAARRKSEPPSPDLDAVWPTILDAYGAAEQAHKWPAQKLLDYGQAVLGSLRPDMIYVGGTDPGRWIPALLNETGEGTPHVVLTQNALADGTYLKYLGFLYGDRIATLTDDDSKRAFKDYLDDAQRRLEHDQQFPDEPRQVRPGEDIRTVDGRTQVGGQVAVMAINEKLLQTLMEKNPEAAFALQESYPFKTTYADAVPLGPTMELRVQGEQNKFTADRAAQSLEYWQTTTQQVLADPDAYNSPDTLKTYSHDVNSSANLLAAHHYTDEAEQAYRLSSQLWPGNPEPVGGLAGILARNGRADEARQVLEDFTRQFPEQRNTAERIKAFLWTPASAQAPRR